MNRMTKRERFLATLSGAYADALTWAPNFDYWLAVNTARGSLPTEYVGLSRNDIVRAVDATIWARAPLLRSEMPNVAVSCERLDERSTKTTYRSSAGTVDTVSRACGEDYETVFLVEHMIKTPHDISVVRQMVEDITFTIDERAFLQSEADVGDDGISLVSLPFCVPFIQFGKTDAGWISGIYLWNDYPALVEELLGAYEQKALEAAKLIGCSQAKVIISPDNMDELTMPPNLFARYAIPYYRKITQILMAAGKILEVHWCGRTKSLLRYVDGTGIGVIEALVCQPMANLTIPEALETLEGVCVVQGGVPSVMMCESWGTRDELRRYVEELLETVSHHRGFALGMSDNVPPDADFDRVQIISDIVNQYGCCC